MSSILTYLTYYRFLVFLLLPMHCANVNNTASYLSAQEISFDDLVQSSLIDADLVFRHP